VVGGTRRRAVAFAFNVLLIRSLLLPGIVGLVWVLIAGFGLIRRRKRRQTAGPPDLIDVSRERAVGWSIGVGIVLVIGLVVFLPSIIRDNYGKELSSYYSAIKKGEIEKAYASLGTRSRESISEGEFRDRLNMPLDDLGAIKSFRPLRGDVKVGYTVLTGQRRELTSLMPVTKEGGSWKPCPVDQPLGTLVPVT